jgi:hypothetical protein
LRQTPRLEPRRARSIEDDDFELERYKDVFERVIEQEIARGGGSADQEHVLDVMAAAHAAEIDGMSYNQFKAETLRSRRKHDRKLVTQYRETLEIRGEVVHYRKFLKAPDWHERGDGPAVLVWKLIMTRTAEEHLLKLALRHREVSTERTLERFRDDVLAANHFLRQQGKKPFRPKRLALS